MHLHLMNLKMPLGMMMVMRRKIMILVKTPAVTMSLRIVRVVMKRLFQKEPLL